MPELPEVARFRTYFEEHSLRRRIAFVRVNDPRIIREASPQEFAALKGAVFTSTRQHGKYLFALLDRGKWVVMHFGMTGCLMHFDSGEGEPAYCRVLFGFEADGTLAYVNRRMLGWVGLADSPEALIEGRRLGPSALDEACDWETFKKRLAGHGGAIKPALMNQEIIAGIGNLYSDEILFQARIHPMARLSSLDEDARRRVFRRMKEVLATAVARKADMESYPAGCLLRGRRRGAGCPVCGSKLETMKIAGRTAFFCSKCQPRD